MELSKYDAQAICDDLKEIVNFDINYVNNKGIMIASTRPERIGIHHLAALKSIKTREKLIISKAEENDIYLEGINSPIFSDSDVIGVISINGPVKIVEKYIDIITKMTQIYINGLAYQKSKNQVQEEKKKIIENIMFNQNVENLIDELNKYQIKISSGLYMIVIELGEVSHDVTSNFKQTSDIIIANVGKQLIALISANNKQDALNFINLKIIPKLDTKIFKIGIGSFSNSIETLYSSYKNAYSALKAINNYDQKILYYEDVTFEIIISTLNEKVRNEILEKTFAKFATEKKHEYYTILKTFFGANKSLTQTSEILFLHKNTILYRLDKIHQITGYNPREFTQASFLYLALLLFEQEL